MLHNSIGPVDSLPRTAGWGYPEPYTRDLLLAILGIAVTQNTLLHSSIKQVLETLAANQTTHGHIPSLVNDPKNVGASDTTPLFLLAVGIYRTHIGEEDFLGEAVEKALNWMAYQSPSDRYMVVQQPTSDWRDEQWVLGYGLYVNTIYYSALQLLGKLDRAQQLADEIHEYLLLDGPYYAVWTYKIYADNRFDLLGNSLAILSGLASREQAAAIIAWIEQACQKMRDDGQLALGLPPNYFPYIYPEDQQWHDRYTLYNQPGDYHNGGIWPFICGLYIAALVASGAFELAEEKLLLLTDLVKKTNGHSVTFGFNEWINAQSGEPRGQDWQTWSAALYLYAAKCVEDRMALIFNDNSGLPYK
ncbi:Alkaline and neutral invertase [bacterium A37T11]|nr:Alkaline and neutral invertase [bacterium A37T11]